MQNTYLLLTKFEVRTVSYGLSFFHYDLWPTHFIQAEKPRIGNVQYGLRK